MTAKVRTSPPPAPRLSSADHWRLAYERTAAQLEVALALLQRQAGPMPTPRPSRTPEDVEDVAVRRAEEQVRQRVKEHEEDFLANAVAGLVAQGHSPEAAKREAIRMRQEVTDMAPPA